MSKDDPFSGPSDKSFGDISGGRYYFPDPHTGKPGHYTRVTTFAKSVSDTYLLSLWQQRMAVKGITMRPDLLARAASLSVDDRKPMNEVVDAAKEAAGSTSGANLGSALHSFTERHDRGESGMYVPPPWDADLAAYVALCGKESLTPLPDMIERTVYNSTFRVCGTLDRAVSQTVTEVDGTKVGLGRIQQVPRRRILDLKTGKSLDWGWGEIAVQLYCYASADFVWNADAGEWEPLEPFDTSTALVVHLPVGRKTATLYELDLGIGETGAHLCMKVRDWRGRRTATPIAKVEL